MRRKIIYFIKFIQYISLSLLFALLIRLFLCNFYTVASDSMEPTILPGDFIFTDKYTYGARIFTKLKFDKDDDPPMMQVQGLRSIQRNDVIAFHFPYRHEWDTIRMSLEKIFVKRCIGLPGDSISAIGGFYHISGLTDIPGYEPEQKRLIDSRSTLDSSIIRAATFDKTFQWDVFDFGPLYIPVAGATIALTPENIKLYYKQIIYETQAIINRKDSYVYINDTLRQDYTFRSNWYFVAGDKATNSQDSRYIGLIPEAYIIGRASLVITSKDKETGKWRWNRMFMRIK